MNMAIPQVDLNGLLEMEKKELVDRAGQRLVVVKYLNDHLALVVDKVLPVIEPHQIHIKPLSPWLSATSGGVVSGIGIPRQELQEIIKLNISKMHEIEDVFLGMEQWENAEHHLVLLLDMAKVFNRNKYYEDLKKMESVVQWEEKLDKGLKELEQFASHIQKQDETIRPQLSFIIDTTEKESEKVLIELDEIMDHVGHLVDFASHLRGMLQRSSAQVELDEEPKIKKCIQTIEEECFMSINGMQFQDVIRQKLERVLVHILKLENVLESTTE